MDNLDESFQLMMKQAALTLFVLLSVYNANGQSQRQCGCNEVRACQSELQGTLMPCADKCQKYATGLGANYPALRSCFQQRDAQIRAATQCTVNSFPNACTNGPSRMIPKRYTASLEIAIANEVNQMLSRSGVMQQVQGLFSTGRKFFKCLQQCMTKNTCASKLNCGLDLPADNILVATGKQCAIRSGFSTASIQQMCNCAVSAGVRQLSGICPRLIVS